MTFDATILARPAIVSMKAYESARSQMTASTAQIYMDANELAHDAQEDLARYPDPQPRELVTFVTQRFAVPQSQLFLGAGVDDAIDALLRVFCEAGQDNILITPPTYGFYSVAAAIQGCGVREAPLRGESFDLDEVQILKSLDANTKLVFVCNPNNPTGNTFSSDRLLRLAREIGERALLVVDEAYIEFSRERSLVAAVASTPNLVVLRTLSKAWGLAGVRLGSAIAGESVIKLMHKVRAPYPIARPAVAAASAALLQLSPAALTARTLAVAAERERLGARLRELDFVLKVYPSEANFILVRVKSARDVMQRTAARGIILRNRSNERGLADCVRISIGTRRDNDALLEALTAEVQP
ncbi:MAG: histidinol-phosphate transaminase [Deltaproteobacteria bacterium]|nr:histidinol-phosphate transaminase [Deltaproteobacteria bacterium]